MLTVLIVLRPCIVIIGKVSFLINGAEAIHLCEPQSCQPFCLLLLWTQDLFDLSYSWYVEIDELSIDRDSSCPHSLVTQGLLDTRIRRSKGNLVNN